MVEAQVLFIVISYLLAIILAGFCLVFQKIRLLKFLSWSVFVFSIGFIIWCFLDKSHVFTVSEKSRSHIYYQTNIFIYFGFLLSTTFLFLAHRRKFIYDTYFHFLVFFGLALATVLRYATILIYFEIHVTAFEKQVVYFSHIVFILACLLGLIYLIKIRKHEDFRYLNAIHPTILFALMILFFHLLSIRLFLDETNRFKQEVRITSHILASQISELAKKQKNILEAVVLGVSDSAPDVQSVQAKIKESVFNSIDYSSRLDFVMLKTSDSPSAELIHYSNNRAEYSIVVPVIHKEKLVFYAQLYINLEQLMKKAHEMIERPFINIQIYNTDQKNDELGQLVFEIKKDEFRNQNLMSEQYFEVYNAKLLIKSYPTWDVYRSSLTPIPRFVYLMGFLLAIILAHLFFVYKCLSQSFDLVESQVKERTKELEIQKKKTEVAHQTQTLFLANMSHEIRTPLNIMSGVTDLLLDSELNSQQRNYISMLQNASSKLLRLINDLIDLSKVETGQIALREDLFDLKKMLQDVTHFYQVKASEKSLKLIVDEQMLVNNWYIGDPVKLKQIIGNLLNNAIKFTETGGATLSVWNEGDVIHFRISDTGVGIPSDKKDEIFDVFVQVDNSFTRKAGGAGLGLSIAKNLIEAMGGSIRVFSELQYGTVFEFEVVLKRYTKSQGQAQVNPVAIDQADVFPENLNILVVDDSLENRQLIKIYLSKYHCNILEAENGLDAVEIADNQLVDVILMDLQMPVLDGYTAIERIRTTENNFHKRHIPIIVITAHALKEDESRCREVGANDYLTKPLSRNKLTYAILNQLTMN